VPTETGGRVTAFLEKDPHPITDQINAGTYVFQRAVIDSIPTGRPVSVERETFPQLLAAGAQVCGYVDTAYWRDLGRPSDFICGSADLVTGIVSSPALPGPVGERLVLPGADVDPAAVVTGGSTVGRDCRVAAGAIVDASVLMDGAVIEPGAVVRRSAIGRGAHVAAGAELEDVVIGDRARVGARVELRAGARVWPDVTLPDLSVRFSSDA
jgi:mannose-1-phosphate guanylyltransferase